MMEEQIATLAEVLEDGKKQGYRIEEGNVYIDPVDGYKTNSLFARWNTFKKFPLGN